MFYKWVDGIDYQRAPRGYMRVDRDYGQMRSLYVLFPFAPVVALCRKWWWTVESRCLFGGRRRSSKLWQEGFKYGRMIELAHEPVLDRAAQNCTCGAAMEAVKADCDRRAQEAIGS